MNNYFKGFIFIISFLFSTLLAKAQTSIQQEYELADTTLASNYLLRSDSLKTIGKFAEAFALAYRADTIYSKIFGGIHEEHVAVWDLLGKIHYFNQDRDSAYLAFKKALNYLDKTLGLQSKEVIQLYNNLSHTCPMDERAAYQLKALEKQRLLFPKDSTLLAKRYQAVGTAYQFQEKPKEALLYHEKSYLIRKKSVGPEAAITAISMTDVGTAYGQMGYYRKEVDFLEKALVILEASKEYQSRKSTCQINLAVAYGNIGEYEKANALNFIILGRTIDKHGEVHQEVATAYNNIGNTYLSAGQIMEAIEYFNNALKAFPPKLVNHYLLSYFYQNLGVAYGYLGDYAKVIAYQKKSLAIKKEALGEKHATVASTLSNLAIGYDKLERYDEAIDFYKEAIQITQAIGNENHPKLVTMYSNLGISYQNNDDLPKAEESFKKALQIAQNIEGIEESGIYFVFKLLGGFYRKKKDFAKAIDYYQKSLAITPDDFFSHTGLASTYTLSEDFQDAEILFLRSIEISNPKNISELKELGYLQNYTDANYLTANFYYDWYLKETHPEKIYLAKNYLEQTIAAIDYQIKSKSSPFLSKKAEQVFDLASRIYFDLYELTDSTHYIKELFSFSEKNKSFILFKSLQESNALKIAGIPDSLLKKERSYQSKIAYLEKQQQEKLKSGATTADTNYLNIGGKIFDLKEQYDLLKLTFEEQYPKYYAAKYDLSILSIEALQKNLRAEQSLIEYMLIDSAIFILLIQKNNYEVHRVSHDFALQNWVNQMTRDGIYGYYTRPQDQQNDELEEITIFNYVEAAQHLYKKLLQPVANKLTEELIIVPDEILGYIPFEALLTAAPKNEINFKTYPYLIYDYQISYCYSATLLQEMTEKQHSNIPTETFLGMAPFFQGNITELTARMDTLDYLASRSATDTLAMLKNTGEEIATINKLIGGKAYYGKEANLNVFQKTAEQYRFLHLSTHGKADDRIGDYTFLAFSTTDSEGTFQKLFARDLYTYSLNADMVVLSACETGIGRLQKGEGIISLSRAFAYAGAKSVFTTLWQVQDEASKDLMIDFYKNLRQNKRKDAALHEAKLSFLKSNSKKSGGEYLHPYYWAGFIGIGDMKAIK